MESVPVASPLGEKVILCPKDIPVFPLPKEGEDKVENPATAWSEGDDSFLFPLTLTLSPNGERESMKMSYCFEGNLLTHFVKMGILLFLFVLDNKARFNIFIWVWKCRLTEEVGTMIQEIEQDIRQFLKKNSDPAIVSKYSRYFREGYDPYGVGFEKLTPKMNEWFNTYQEELTRKELLTLCDHLLSSGKYEEASIAIGFMVKLRDKYDKGLFNTVGRWFEKYITNWAHCDAACHSVLYPFLMDKIIGFEDLLDWTDSRYRWKRRAVPVTVLKTISQEGNVAPALRVARKLILDSEKVVQQGTGWLLREAWKKSPKEVENFLLGWKDRAPRLIIQYATEKIDKNKRKRFRRA